MLFERKKLAIIISTLCLSGPAALVAAQEQQQTPGATTQTDEPQKDAKTSVAKDESVGIELQKAVITGERTADEKGHDAVYDANVTSVYQDREQLQRFQATNPGDVFKGMNGVYSMDTRSSSAITPNIRGLSGEGRVPLTIDGTEQSTNVWLHMFGTGNRSYADPALFRSIEVEKGPSLSRGTKSGVGGAVNIRTIDANDIIPEGDSWGIETNLSTSGNTIKRSHDPESFFGKDYRDIPGATRWNNNAAHIDSADPRKKGSSSVMNFDDHTEMLTIAGRNEFVDILISRSERSTGNYFAGKKNAGKYEGHDIYDEKSTDRFIPNLTKLYVAGSEVFNTDSETDTTLIKNNWYLPNEQKIGLQFMRTDTTFGETTAGESLLNWQYREAFEKTDPTIDFSTYPLKFVHERPRTELRLDSYKINYEAKPLDNNWVDLEVSLWKTKAQSTRFQTGANPWGLNIDETTQLTLFDYDWWMTNYPDSVGLMYPDGEPEHDGTIHPEGQQWTTHDRTGFDLSNLFHLSDNLQLLLATSYQQEKLSEQVQNSDIKANGLFPTGAGLHLTTGLLGPRAGERKEYSAMFNLDWQPTPWLTLTAGTRYMRYKGKDVGLEKMRRMQNEMFKTTRYKTGMELEWGTPLSIDERAARTQVADAAYADAFERKAAIAAFDNGRQYGLVKYNGYNYAVWKETAFVPFKDGKLDASQNPFANGEIDTELLYQNAIEAMGQDGNANRIIAKVPGVLAGSGIDIYERLGASQGWEAPEEQSGDAFSPVLSATARVTPFGAIFMRYAQTTRFPSINELTSGTLINGELGNLAINGASKPERSINWEVGYSHDLTQFFPSLLLADARMSYYNTEIRHFIDRNIYYETIQFDKKKSSGIELQSRFDSGRYFGSLGVTYRLKQKLCDKDYASGMDPFYNRIPECVTGGFPGTYSGNSLQPKYSLDMLLGTRLFNDKLELGWRSTYHKGAENKQVDNLLSSQEGPGNYGSYVSDVWFTGGLDGFYWRSVLLHDIYANFKVNDAVALNVGITNVTDEYYLDPMSKTLLPGPGRTVTAGLKVTL